MNEVERKKKNEGCLGEMKIEWK